MEIVALDAVEVINVGNFNEEFDKKALIYANKHRLPVTTGTDANGYENCHSPVACKHKIENVYDYIRGIQFGSYELIKPK